MSSPDWELAKLGFELFEKSEFFNIFKTAPLWPYPNSIRGMVTIEKLFGIIKQNPSYKVRTLQTYLIMSFYDKAYEVN